MGKAKSYLDALATIEKMYCIDICVRDIRTCYGCEFHDALNKLYSLLDKYQTIKEAVKE